jgi:hypothetical protein
MNQFLKGRSDDVGGQTNLRFFAKFFKDGCRKELVPILSDAQKLTRVQQAMFNTMAFSDLR